MAVTLTQYPVTTSATRLFTIPGQKGTVIVSNNSGQTVYLGNSSTVATTNGFGIASGAPPVEIPVGQLSSPTDVWAIAGAAASVGVILSFDG